MILTILLYIFYIITSIGRSDIALRIAERALKLALSLNKLVVVDADALVYIESNLSSIIGQKNCFLTPNIAEFKRLGKLL